MEARILWNGQGGELDSATIIYQPDDDDAIRKALVKLIGSNIVNPGDSFVIEEVE